MNLPPSPWVDSLWAPCARHVGHRLRDVGHHPHHGLAARSQGPPFFVAVGPSATRLTGIRKPSKTHGKQPLQRCYGTVDGRNVQFAPCKKPWNESIPRFEVVQDIVHPQYHFVLGMENPQGVHLTVVRSKNPLPSSHKALFGVGCHCVCGWSTCFAFRG